MGNSEKSIPGIVSSCFVPSFTVASFTSPAVNFKYLQVYFWKARWETHYRSRWNSHCTIEQGSSPG